MQRHTGTVDRRRFRPIRLWAIGVVTGFLCNAPVVLAYEAAPLNAWLQPNAVMALAAIVLSVGSAWQMVAEDRRRIAALEDKTVHVEVFKATMQRIDTSLEQITRRMDTRFSK